VRDPSNGYAVQGRYRREREERADDRQRHAGRRDGGPAVARVEERVEQFDDEGCVEQRKVRPAERFRAECTAREEFDQKRQRRERSEGEPRGKQSLKRMQPNQDAVPE
jgi:hypothetical protein